MAIEVVQGSPQAIWVPIKDGETIYVGGIVAIDSSGPTEGIQMLPDAAGIANFDNLDVPFGVCIGTNRKTPLHDATYNTDKITDPGAADAHGGASIEYVGVEGPMPKGDQIAMAKVALITPHTILRASLFNAAVTAAPSVLTVTTGNTSGVAATTGSADFAGITTPIQTLHFRSGNNAGVYRMTDSASQTAHTWDRATVSDVAIGDTCVTVPVPTFGFGTVMFDGTSATFIDCADAPVATGLDRWVINVVRLDLNHAGREVVEFSFAPMHFNVFSQVST